MRNVPNATATGTCHSMAGYAEDLPTVQRPRLGQGYAEPVAAKKKRAAPREGAALQDHDEGNETTGERSR